MQYGLRGSQQEQLLMIILSIQAVFTGVGIQMRSYIEVPASVNSTRQFVVRLTPLPHPYPRSNRHWLAAPEAIVLCRTLSREADAWGLLISIFIFIFINLPALKWLVYMQLKPCLPPPCNIGRLRPYPLLVQASQFVANRMSAARIRHTPWTCTSRGSAWRSTAAWYRG